MTGDHNIWCIRPAKRCVLQGGCLFVAIFARQPPKGMGFRGNRNMDISVHIPHKTKESPGQTGRKLARRSAV